MDLAQDLVIPFMLILARVSGMVAVMPVLGWRSAPVRIRVGIAVILSVFFAFVIPPATGIGTHWVAVGIWLAREVTTGVAIGLVAALLYSAVRQAGLIIRRQMGMAIASVIDPMSGEQSTPVGQMLEMIFMVFFLVAGGHRLLIRVMARSWDAFPMGAAPTAEGMAEAVTSAGSAMLGFALQLAAPMIAAFLLLSVLLAIVARVLPEMNILFTSLPLRVGLGIFLAAALVPSLHTFASRIGHWLNVFLP